MIKLEDVLEHWVRGYKNGSQGVDYTTQQTLQSIRSLIVEVVENTLNGCDGYEKESESVKCQWCGETEYSSAHDRARLIKKVEEL